MKFGDDKIDYVAPVATTVILSASCSILEGSGHSNTPGATEDDNFNNQDY